MYPGGSKGLASPDRRCGRPKPAPSPGTPTVEFGPVSPIPSHSVIWPTEPDSGALAPPHSRARFNRLLNVGDCTERTQVRGGSGPPHDAGQILTDRNMDRPAATLIDRVPIPLGLHYDPRSNLIRVWPRPTRSKERTATDLRPAPQFASRCVLKEGPFGFRHRVERCDTNVLGIIELSRTQFIEDVTSGQFDNDALHSLILWLPDQCTVNILAA